MLIQRSTFEVPQELVEKLIADTKEKYPSIDDAIVRDIINSHIKSVQEYFLSL